jgi:predicted phage terminase large subunit-like protein
MALWPQRWSAAYLRALQAADPRGFRALYQQEPQLAEGDFFEAEWFERGDLYVDMIPMGTRFVRYWDKAATEGGSGAFSAGVLVGQNAEAERYYLCDVVRGRWGVGVREDMIDRIAMIDGPEVEIVIEQEPGSGGKESADNTAIRLRKNGFRVYIDRVTGDKPSRAWPIASAFAAGIIHIVSDRPNRRWNDAYVTECIDFPQGAFKDQVDASAGAYNRLALKPIPGGVEVSGPRLGIEHNFASLARLSHGVEFGGEAYYPDPDGGSILQPEYELMGY